MFGRAGVPGLKFTLSMYTPSESGDAVQSTRGQKQRDVPPFCAPGLDATIVPEALAINILVPLRFHVILACQHALPISITPRHIGFVF